MSHSSTLERRLPVHLHPQPAAPTAAPLTQQDADSEMVEILIWNRHDLDGPTQLSSLYMQLCADEITHNKAHMFVFVR